MSAKRRAANPSSAAGKPKKPKQPKTAKTRLKKAAKWSGIGLLVLGLLGVGAFLVLYNTIKMPDPNSEFQTQTSFVYYQDGKSEVGRFEEQNRESISLKEMPETLQDAVVAAENQSFWTDKGIDPKGILRAAFSNAQGNSQQGASTITQQYIKILYLNQERSYTRKVKEAILSLKVQREQSKSEILTGYLNTIYFGRSAYGVQAASQAWFGVDAKDLNLKQSAVLASVINNPNYLDPARGKDAKKSLKGRYQYTLKSMAKTGTITQEEADAASQKLPKFPEQKASSKLGGQKGHMLTLVRNEVKQKLGLTDQQIDSQGLRITATFDRKVMDAARNAVVEQRPEGFGDKQLHIGAATVEVGTGAVRGFYGGQDYLQSQINWAATGGMAGSTMKAFANAAAVKAGFSIRDSFDGNSPYEFPGGLEVNNQGHRSYGRVSMIKATQNSINTAYMDMTQAMPDGSQKIYDMALRMGVPGPESSPKFPGIPSTSPDLSPEDALVALGRGRVSPINMATGYATIANRGVRADAYVVEKVTTKDGEVLYKHKDKSKRVLDEEIADDVSYTLQQTVSGGSGRNAQAIGRPAGGKTGTATNAKDEVSSMWFAGFTPELSTAIMYVRGDGDDGLDDWLPDSTGGGYPTRTWAALMEPALEGLERQSFPPPVYVDGEAPSTGHSYVPPARPAPQRKPEKKPTKAPSMKPKPSKEPEPEPTPEPPAPPVTPEPAPTTPPPPPPTTAPPVPTPPVTPPPATP